MRNGRARWSYERAVPIPHGGQASACMMARGVSCRGRGRYFRGERRAGSDAPVARAVRPAGQTLGFCFIFPST